MWRRLKEDIQTVFAKDPAARSTMETIFCYPGMQAIWFHRISHFLWRRGFRFLARFLSAFGRFLTGVDIHPGARIGQRFFIDHGSGVVIGETAEIGDDVLMYQGAVLGGTSLKKGKRHPTVGSNVVLGAGCVILGPIMIGDNVRVGSNSVVLKSVPAGATVVGVPGKTVEDRRYLLPALEHGKLPDPVAEAIHHIVAEQVKLGERLKKLEQLYVLPRETRQAREPD